MGNREVISKIERLYKATECQCDYCKERCKKSPCIGTPEDILRLIEAGYKGKLTITLNFAGFSAGIADNAVIMVIPKYEENGCVFLKDGKCEVHSIKPTEGKYTYHKRPETEDMPLLIDADPSINVFRSWCDGSEEVRKCISYFSDKYDEFADFNKEIKIFPEYVDKVVEEFINKK